MFYMILICVNEKIETDGDAKLEIERIRAHLLEFWS
jgi:hypothetical protein